MPVWYHDRLKLFQNSSTSNHNISWDAIFDSDLKWTKNFNLSFFVEYIYIVFSQNFTEDSGYRYFQYALTLIYGKMFWGVSSKGLARPKESFEGSLWLVVQTVPRLITIQAVFTYFLNCLTVSIFFSQ